MDINSARAGSNGATAEQIEAVDRFRGSSLFAPAEKAALELAEAASQTPAAVSDEIFAKVRQYYGEAELVELAATIALENFNSRFNRVFDVEAQGLYCPLPSGGAAP